MYVFAEIATCFHSSGKIRVLDLTNRDFWTKWTGTCEGYFSHQVTRQKKPVETCPYSGVKKYVNVVTDLKVWNGECNECNTYLWQWAQQRKGAVPFMLSKVGDFHINILSHCHRLLKVCRSPLCKEAEDEIYMDRRHGFFWTIPETDEKPSHSHFAAHYEGVKHR